MKNFILLFLMVISGHVWGQQKNETDKKKLELTGDFRFRLEKDWNSQNQNGILRNDRNRLRYRFRFGMTYSLDAHSSFGGRLRSGNINDQQGPHVTLGSGTGEFGLTRIGLEKLYFKYKNKGFSGWVGKNAIPLTKLNEIFWNDNVFPEGVALKYCHSLSENSIINSLSGSFGHFIIHSKNKSLSDDSYLQTMQLTASLFDDKFKIFPALYRFKRIGNYPDLKHTFEMDYTIFHVGSQLVIHKEKRAKIGLELYNNLEDYTSMDSIHTSLKDEKIGLVVSAQYGELQKKGDWLFYLSYAYVQKYAVVDYFAQNDWSRWDYSSVGAAGSRITNFQGIQLKLGYAFNKKFNLVLRTYIVEQLVSTENFKENGNRIRLDINIGF